MSVFIKRIINSPIPSNCFVIYTQNIEDKCIIVDPGSEDSSELISFLQVKNITPQYIILTHEHFDHIWSVNSLKKKYSCQIVASQKCSEYIVLEKRNMSVFYNQIGFKVPSADVIIEDINYELNWNDHKLIFIETPGHTEGSICFSIENHLFTGDTLIQNQKIVTKLPGGNMHKAEDSTRKIMKTFSPNTLVYAGHGDSFKLHEF